MKVKSLTANWHQRIDSSIAAGEDFDVYEVGNSGVVSIQENEPHNGMQLWNYFITKEDGTRLRVFNPNFVEYFKEE